MSKMGSNDPFGHLKHKLWPKEGAKSQSANLLNRESPNFENFETPNLGQNDICV